MDRRGPPGLGRGGGPPRGAPRGPRGGYQDSSSAPAGPRQFGVVASLKDNFGFIRGTDHGDSQQFFFHYSEVIPDGSQGRDPFDLLQIGAEVEFSVQEPGPRQPNGKPVAVQVAVLAVKSLVTGEERIPGRVVRELRGGQRNPSERYGGRISFQRDGREESIDFNGDGLAGGASKGPRLGLGDEVLFSVCENARTRERTAVEVELVARAAAEPATNAPAGGEERGADAAGQQQQQQPPPGLRAVAGPAPGREFGFVATLKEGYGFIRQPGQRRGHGPGLFFHFTGLERGTSPADLHEGCEVAFEQSVDRRTGKPVALGVAVLPPGTIPREERGGGGGRDRDGAGGDGAAPLRSDAAEGWRSREGANPGAQRMLGAVEVLKDTYGFIKCCDRAEDLFFHFSNLRCKVEELSLGTDVAFFLQKDHRGNPGAVHVDLAPKGSAVFEDVTEERFSGVCRERVPYSKGPSRADPGEAAGLIELAPQAAAGAPAGGEAPPAAEEGADAAAAAAEASPAAAPEQQQQQQQQAPRGETLPFRKGDLEDGRLQPKQGDCVTFAVATDRRTGARRATRVALAVRSGAVAKVLTSYGFIEYVEPPQRGADGEAAQQEPGSTRERIFFHASEVEGGLALNPGDEVEFVVTHPRGKERNARRVRRTKEAPQPPPREAEAERTPNKEKKQFEGRKERMAKGPDGPGFGMGRGKPLLVYPPLSALRITAPPFTPGSTGGIVPAGVA